MKIKYLNGDVFTKRNHTKLMVIDDLPPEDVAMLQALYSRSAESAENHIERAKKSSGKFMNTYYVGYGHKSIADCGSTTMFIENVSLLAAKAIQDWPLYSGQETSTRYIDMSKQHIIDPLGTKESGEVLNAWMEFYTSNQGDVAKHVKEKYPRKHDEKEDIYDKAVAARVFDIMRGFLPAGITTQLSWHSNLRQAGDHLTWLVRHPSSEIRELAKSLRNLLGEAYPSSGLGLGLPSVSGVDSKNQREQDERSMWETVVADIYTYLPPKELLNKGVMLSAPVDMPRDLEPYEKLLSTRPRGSILPHFLSDLGQCTFTFLLDFGSFRDIQRHRHGVCRMPLLTTRHGFEPWYIEQLGLGSDLGRKASNFVADQTIKILNLTSDPIVRQYYTALGYRVPTTVTYGLPATVYVLELRSGKTVHPTLRSKIQEMVTLFRTKFPTVKLHTDDSLDDWTVRRGMQDIQIIPPGMRG